MQSETSSAFFDSENGMRKTTVVLDLDGVVYDYMSIYRWMLKEYRGVEMPPTSEAWTEWDGQKNWGAKEDHEWMEIEGVLRGLYRYGHAVRGARRGMETLVELGYDLSIATKRPAAALIDTLDWMSLYFKDIPIQEFHSIRRGESKAKVSGDVLIDDSPDNVRQWWTKGTFSRPARHSILFRHSANKDFDWPLVVYDWADIENVMEDVEQRRRRKEVF